MAQDQLADENLLLEKRTVFQALIENASDIITILDEDGLIRYESPAVERVLGYKPQELIGKSGFELVHPDDIPHVAAAFAQVVGSRASGLGVEFRYRHKQGGWRILELTGTNLLDDESIKGIVVNSRDVTDARNLEEQFRQSQKMQAIGQLAGGVAHDFNNLLMVIRGYTEMLLDGFSPSDPRRENADRVMQAARKASGLTQQLLAFSRKQILSPAVIDLNAVVHDIHRMLPRLVGEDVELRLELEQTLGKVKADRGQIEQVIMNMAANARDAMPRGGVITISTTNIETAGIPGKSEACSWVRLSFRDTGTGMDEETRERIFEPFFTTKELGKGTGLGLSTVYGIVKQSDGIIEVESAPGAGTAFHVFLPRVENELSAQSLAQQERVSGSGVVLLVEDEEDVREIMRAALEERGFKVLTANSPVQALGLAGDGRHIDLLLTDVVMPVMNGIDLAQNLRKQRPKLAVLFVSGYPEAGGSANPFLLDNFLQKPFELEALAKRAAAAIAKAKSG